MPPRPSSRSMRKSPSSEPVESAFIQRSSRGALQCHTIRGGLDSRAESGQSKSTMMSRAPQGPHAATAVELKVQIEAERGGLPFLIYRNGSGDHQLLVLDAKRERVTLGRRSSADLALEWDDEVSRLHA